MQSWEAVASIIDQNMSVLGTEIGAALVAKSFASSDQAGRARLASLQAQLSALRERWNGVKSSGSTYSEEINTIGGTLNVVRNQFIGVTGQSRSWPTPRWTPPPPQEPAPEPSPTGPKGGGGRAPSPGPLTKPEPEKASFPWWLALAAGGVYLLSRKRK